MSRKPHKFSNRRAGLALTLISMPKKPAASNNSFDHARGCQSTVVIVVASDMLPCVALYGPALLLFTRHAVAT